MVLVIELVQDPHVLAVAEQPVDGGKVFPLGQLLVQTPEHLVRVDSKRFILYMRFGITPEITSTTHMYVQGGLIVLTKR